MQRDFQHHQAERTGQEVQIDTIDPCCELSEVVKPTYWELIKVSVG
jgi:hypothetical protein